MNKRFWSGIKQLQSVDDNGHVIIDYSIYDAIATESNKNTFNIQKYIEAVCASLGVEVAFAFQEKEKFASTTLKGRKEHLGNGHAVLCASEEINSPFAMIKADDNYGKQGFEKSSQFLESGQYGLVGYILKNTLSENGGVTGGICSVENGKLTGIKETKHLKKCGEGAEANVVAGDIESLVSLNF